MLRYRDRHVRVQSGLVYRVKLKTTKHKMWLRTNTQRYINTDAPNFVQAYLFSECLFVIMFPFAKLLYVGPTRNLTVNSNDASNLHCYATICYCYKNKWVQAFPTTKVTRRVFSKKEVCALRRRNVNTNYHTDYFLPKMVKYRYELLVKYIILQNDVAQTLRPMCCKCLEAHCSGLGQWRF